MKTVLSSFFYEKGRIVSGITIFVSALIFKAFSFDLLSFICFFIVLLIAGSPVFYGAVKGILRRDLLDEKFLMSIAALGSIFIGEIGEGAAVMLFFIIGEYFEHKAVSRSRSSIRSLLDIMSDEARVVENGEEILKDCAFVEIGSIISVRAGERVPIDSVVISGTSNIDTSSLTGESAPRLVQEGMELSGGFIVLDGVLLCRTIRSREDSAASKIIELVEEANENKAKEETFIAKFSRFYTPIVVVFAVIYAIVPPLFSLIEWSEAIYNALTFLVISCPCALVISVPLAFFGGIGCAASNGILFKGGNVFSAISRSKTVVFDKTGTLTTGELAISEVRSYGMDEKQILSFAASVEQSSNHPVAKSLFKSAEKIYPVENVREYSGKGTVGYVNGKKIGVGNKALLEALDINSETVSSARGSVFVTSDGILVGEIDLSDSIRKSAFDCIKALRNTGVRKTVILSGDNREKANLTGELLGIDEVYFELLPEEKYEKVRSMSNSGENPIIYVGDGINDAPTIAVADVGIAMGLSGADSAIEASDVTIMNDNLASIPLAVKIADRTLTVAKQNIIFALGVKALILTLGIIGFANMWLAVFADVGVSVIAILNSMRTLKIK